MKIRSLLTTLACALALTSCVELNSLITVNKDGSGTIEETVLMSAQLKAMVASMPPAQEGAAAGENPAAALSSLVPDKAKAEENAKKYGEGVTVKSVEEVTLPDGRGGAKVTYSFADVSKVQYQPGHAQAEEQGAKQEPVTFTLAGDELKVKIPKGETGNVEKPDAEEIKKMQEIDPAQMAMMKPMFAGMRFSFAVKVAPGIASSDAAYQDADTVTLMDMQVDKLFDNPDTFKKFAALMEEGGEPDPKKMAEEFKGIEGIKIEDKEEVSIKLK